jgi:hypothetical protein
VLIASLRREQSPAFAGNGSILARFSHHCNCARRRPAGAGIPRRPLDRGDRIPLFARHIGIDYSGAEGPEARLAGLRIYLAEGGAEPVEVSAPRSVGRWWTRKAIAERICDELAKPVPTLVGIDHGFSCPLRYFEEHRLPRDWPAFLDDFQRHWPTDRPDTHVDFIRAGIAGQGALRTGNARWRRLTELRAGRAKSVFHFDVPGSVAKSTHAGLPWLRYIRNTLRDQVHFWPFDGWATPLSRPVIAEIYPSLWRASFPVEGLTRDQHDAYAAAAWLSRADRDGRLAAAFHPALSPADREIAEIEGWILGVAA